MTSVYVQSASQGRSFVTRHLAGETLIVPVAGGVAELECIYVLNGTGARIWDLLAEPATAEQLARTIANEFEVSLEGAAQDVSEFLESLLSGGLVQRSGEQP